MDWLINLVSPQRDILENKQGMTIPWNNIGPAIRMLGNVIVRREEEHAATSSRANVFNTRAALQDPSDKASATRS
eukprot:10976922-Prorocentrum_lima.AAC.1